MSLKTRLAKMETASGHDFLVALCRVQRGAAEAGGNVTGMTIAQHGREIECLRRDDETEAAFTNRVREEARKQWKAKVVMLLPEEDGLL